MPSTCNINGPSPGRGLGGVALAGATADAELLGASTAFDAAALEFGWASALPSAGVQATVNLTPRNRMRKPRATEAGGSSGALLTVGRLEARNTPHFALTGVARGKIPSVKEPASPDFELNALPRVDQLLARPGVLALSQRWGESWVKLRAREVLDELRVALRAEQRVAVDLESVERRLLERVPERPGLRSVINATGVVLHTGLGRAPLGEQVSAELGALGSYSDLELDLSSGKRSKRGAKLGGSLAAWLGAEACHFTGNNAGAVLLCLAEIAAGREVLVSRGELIEIGGGFRIPEMLELSGARLVEVGTTNRTRLADYERALRADTACILRVHPSNFRSEGFVERPTLGELCELGARAGIPVIKDLGGGRVTDLGALSRMSRACSSA